jgi:hypothetical protein
MVVDDLVTLLTTSIGGVTIFTGTKAVLPTSGDTPFLQVILTGGMAPSRVQNQVQPPAFQQPGAQITARGTVPATTWALIDQAYAALNVRNTTVNSRRYLEISPKQEPFDRGQDPQGRLMLTFNVNVITIGV